MIISLMGNDGSGKTTIATKLYDFFKEIGVNVTYIHEYDYQILRFFFRIIGSKRLEKARADLIVQKKKGKYYLWPIIVWFDRLIHFIYLKLFMRNTVVILDRYPYDHYLSFVHSGHMRNFGTWLYHKFPKPDLGIILWVEPEVAYNRKKETHSFDLNYYKTQTQRYFNLSKSKKFPLLNTQVPVNETFREIQRILIKEIYKKNCSIISKMSNNVLPSNIALKISIIIPTFNRNSKLNRLLDSLINEVNSIDKQIEILIIDDSEENISQPLVNKFKVKLENNLVKILHIPSGGDKYSSFCRNLGVKKSTGDILIFIDDDNELSGNVIKNLVECFENHPLIGMIGILNYEPNGKIWCNGGKISKHTFFVTLTNMTNSYSLDKFKIVDYIPNLYALRKNIFLNIKGFDSKIFPQGMEETDLALRVWKSGNIVCTLQNSNVYTIHLIDNKKNKPMRPERYYLRGRARILFYSKHYKNLLKWKGVPDLLLRSINSLKYNISFNEKKKLISEYKRGTKDAFSLIEG